MIRKTSLLFLLFLGLLSCGFLSAQTAREFKPAADSLRTRLSRRTSVNTSLKLTKVMKRGSTLDFYFSQELGDYPWRQEDLEWFRDQLRSLTPAPYRSYTLGDIFAKKTDLNTLPMPLITNNGKPVQTGLRRSDPRSRTPLVRTEEKWSKGLYGHGDEYFHHTSDD